VFTVPQRSRSSPSEPDRCLRYLFRERETLRKIDAIQSLGAEIGLRGVLAHLGGSPFNRNPHFM